jgi:signal transduction histidine kinase
MEIKDYISDLYPKVNASDEVHFIKEKLLEHEYLVVTCNNEYVGILTPYDFIKCSGNIFIDCITAKEHIMADDTIITVIDKFRRNKGLALPVFKGSKFIGVIEKNNLLDKLKNRVSQLSGNLSVSQNFITYFLRNLSHEVRTPLNSILGFLELLSDWNGNDIKTSGGLYYEIIRQNSDRFLLVLYDLIDLSLIESGHKMEINEENFTIESILASIKKLFETSNFIISNEVSVQYMNPDISMTMYSDQKKIEHILYHLINITIKFSAKGIINYGYKHDDQFVTLFVNNSTAKIDKKEQHIEAFYNSANNHDCLDIFGISLVWVTKMTEVLGGTINYSADDRGLTFNVTLPMNKSAIQECNVQKNIRY